MRDVDGWRPSGALPDPQHHIDRSKAVGALLGGEDEWIDPLPEYSLKDFSPPVRDQSATNACCGFEGVTSPYVTARYRGIDIPELSPLALYTMARLLERQDEGISDTGTFPALIYKAQRDYGLLPEESWPFERRGINQRIPFGLLNRCGDIAVTGVWRIFSDGDERIAEMQRAIMRGYALGITLSLDRSLNDYSGGVLGEPKGETRGNHRVSVIGYRPGNFLIQNSWGKHWGEGGFAWVSHARIVHPTTLDITAVTVVET